MKNNPCTQNEKKSSSSNLKLNISLIYLGTKVKIFNEAV